MRKIGFLFFAFLPVLSFATPIDSLSNVLENHLIQNNFKEIITTGNAIGELLFEEEKYEEAINHFSKSLQLAIGNEFNKEIAEINYNLGKCYLRISNYEEALECFFKVKNISDSYVDTQLQAKNNSQLGIIYKNLGDFEKAYKFQTEALQQHELVGDSLAIVRSLYAIGSIFYYQNQYANALEYYEKSKTLSDKLKFDKYIYNSLEAMASAHSALGDNEKGHQFSLEALTLARKINYQTGIAYTLGNLAADLRRDGKLDEAEKRIRESIQLKSELKDTWGEIGGMKILVDILIDKKQFTNANEVMSEALQLAKKIDSKTRQMQCYERLITIAKNQYNYRKSTEYLEIYLKLKEEAINEKTIEEMGKTKNKYELERKESEIVLLKQKNELLGQNKKIQSLQVYIFISIVIVLLCFGALILVRLRYQGKTNALLEEKNQTIEIKNQEIEEKNFILKNSNEDLQQFAYVASHDLKEPLRMIGSYSSLLKRQYNNVIDENGKEYIHFITDAVQRMQTLLEDLLTYSRAGTQQIQKENLSIGDIIFLTQTNLKQRIEEKNVEIILANPDMPIIESNRTQMVQLFQNLIGNAIKYNQNPTPKVIIDFKKTEKNKIIFSIKDNGIGIKEEHKAKVFEMFSRLHTRLEYEGTGIGLATCKKIVNMHGGKIWLESEEEKGTTFFFSLHVPIMEMELA